MDKIKLLNTPLTTVTNPVTGQTWSIPRVMPGPMEGVMRGCLCRAAAELQLTPGWMTPFLRISVDVPRLSKLKKYIEEFTDSKLPVIVQLMGTDAAKLATAAERLISLGIAGIDVNFACPSSVVVRHGGGGGMLRTPDKMLEILNRLRPICAGISLSAKMRTGFADPQEMQSFIPAVCATGVDFISIHFRTVKELYLHAPGRQERLTTAVRLAGATPVIGSGDVYNLDDVDAICGTCGCQGIMGARGWLRNPTLINEIIDYASSGKRHRNAIDGRKMLFGRMIELARSFPEKYWAKPSFLEAAVFMWGGKDPFFRQLLTVEGEDFLALASQYCSTADPDATAESHQDRSEGAC